MYPSSASVPLPPELTYRREVDGLRAIAVLAVILFHTGWDAAPGGFVGVDIFFVISGFLITCVVLNAQARGRFSLVGFYERRARRILPALVFVTAACLPAAVMLMTPKQLSEFSAVAVSLSVFASNLVLAAQAGYFGVSSAEQPLLHTWSLAVEEQFYLLFPLLMLYLRGKPRSVLPAVLAVVSLASLALAEWGWRHFAEWNFFLLSGRAWELAVGCLAGLLHMRHGWSTSLPPAVRSAVAAVGLACVLGPIFLLPSSTPTPSLYLLVPVAGTASLLLWADGGTLVGKALGLRPLVGIGLVSYSAYLWHQPLFAFLRLAAFGDAIRELRWFMLALVLLLAWLTWQFVEQPFRRGRPVRRRTVMVGSTAGLAGLFTVGACAAWQAASLASRVPEAVLSAFQASKRAAGCFDVPFAHDRQEGWMCRINEGQKPTFAVFGDSHALQLLDAFEVAARAAGRSGVFAGYSGCPPLQDVIPLRLENATVRDCRQLNKRALNYVRENGIKEVYLVAKWSYYTEYSEDRYIHALGFRRGASRAQQDSRQVFSEAFRRTVLSYTESGARVKVITQVPWQSVHTPALYERAWRDSGRTAEILEESSVTLQQHLQQQSFPNSVFRQRIAGAAWDVLNMDELFCNSQRCLVGTPMQPYYLDLSHLTNAGAARAVPLLIDALSTRSEPGLGGKSQVLR